MAPRASRTVRYHLRVALTPEHAAEEALALDSILEDARIDEVLFFVPHAEERSPGLGTPAEIRESADRLVPIFDKLRARGVAPSINIWWTCSFSHFPSLPRVQDGVFTFRWAVTPEGKTSRTAACPRCEAWLRAAREMYAAYAALKPVRLWIDDDVHATLRADVHSACFCDSCLAGMEARAGRKWERASLLAAIVKDPPNPVRDAWLGFQEAIMLDIVAGLASAVHDVSPETRVCLMHSPFEYHSAEGRHWAPLVKALGSPRPTFRPSIGPYIETTSLGIADGLNGTRLMQAALKGAVDIAPEIENYPHTRFGKTAAIVKADLQMAQLFGIPEMTFSIYRFGGRLDLEVKRSRFWQQMLGALKPRLQILANLGIRPEQQQGVGLFFHEESARHTAGGESLTRPVLLMRRRPWDGALSTMGFPVRFGPAPVTAFAGESLAALDPAERARLFQGGVLMDGRAAATLLRLGEGSLAGLAGARPDAGHSHETIEEAAFGGLPGDVMNTRWEGAARQFDWLPGARAVSRLRGYRDEPTGDGVVLFENAAGGRVAVFPFDSQGGAQMSLGAGAEPMLSPSFLSAPRQAQLKDVLTWLGRTPLPMVVHAESPVYPLLVAQPRRWIAAIAALSADGLDRLDIEFGPLPFEVRRIRRLDRTNRWKTVPLERLETTGTGTCRLRLETPLACLEVAVLTLEA
jgi:hypothetical protein